MNALNELAISSTFVGWTEDWEKDKWKTDGAVNKSYFLISIKIYTLFCIILVICITYMKRILCSKGAGWVIYAQCDVPGVEEDEVTIFLAITLIQKAIQVDGVKVMHPEEGSDCNKVLDPDEDNGF